MNKLLRARRIFLSIGVKSLIFMKKVVLFYLSDEEVNKKIAKQKKWSDDYDEYAASVTKRKNL